MDSVFVLVHSPLVGPLTWSLIADDLKRRGIDVVVPELRDVEGAAPYWRQHAESAASALGVVPLGRPIVLVGHSGAGPLLPAIGRFARRPVSAYVFVDAGLPHDGASRLAAMGTEDLAFAQELHQHLLAGGRFPDWSDEDLREAIPDDGLRQAMIAEIRPRPLAFFEEPIPGSVGELDALCAYLQLSPAYVQPAARARQYGWPCRVCEAEHFHMLVDPTAVATAIVDLATGRG